MGVATLAPTRSIHQPQRIDWRVILGIALALGALVGAIAFWTTASDTRAVVVATRDLPAGAILTTDDLTVARVRVDDGMYAAAVPGSEVASLVGRALAEPVHVQQLLVRAQVSRRPPLGPNQLALSIPVSPATAVGGQLQIGDDVEVLLTVNPSKPDERTTVVLPRAAVYDVGRDRPSTAVVADTGDAPPQGAATWLTLVVTPDEAITLARARWAGALDVALLPPRPRLSSNDGSGR